MGTSFDLQWNNGWRREELGEILWILWGTLSVLFYGQNLDSKSVGLHFQGLEMRKICKGQEKDGIEYSCEVGHSMKTLWLELS